MNEFERKLRGTPLRTPPPAWRGEILSALPANQPAVLNWREWLWPPPPAWIALAAVWLFLIGVEAVTRDPSTATVPAAAAFTLPSPDSLLAFHASLNSGAALDLPR